MGLFSAHSSDSDDPLLRPIWMAGTSEAAGLGIGLDASLQDDAASVPQLEVRFATDVWGETWSH